MAPRFVRENGIRVKAMPESRFGRWKTLGCEFKIKGKSLVVCECDCGTIRVVGAFHMAGNASQSCGCLAAERASQENRSHGKSGSLRRESGYGIWSGMISRCFNEKTHAYKDYGGRGITVHQPWVESYEAFISDVGPRPSLKHSIDRFPDNNGNYEPGNVRWATTKEQVNNTRVNHILEIRGEKKTISQWADSSGVPGVNQDRIWNRLYRGWDEESAVFRPLRRWPTTKEDKNGQP